MMTTTRALQIFQVLRQGAVILGSIALAKSTLPLGDIGTYESLLYLGTVLTFFWVNGLLQAMTPVFEKQDQEGKKRFLFSNFVVFNGISLLLFVLLLLGRHWIGPLLQVPVDLEFYPLFCAYLLLHLPSFPVEYYYLLHKKAWHIVGWGLASFGLQVLAVALPVYLGQGLGGSFGALLALAAAKWLWTLRVVLQLGAPEWDAGLARVYLRFAAPLTLNVLIGNLVVMFDAWLVGWFYQDEAIFAIYRYGSRELPLAQALATALGVALVPRLTQDLSGGLADLRAMSLKLMHLLFPLSIVLLWLAPPLFPLIFNPDFAASAPLFGIYLCITASRVLLPNAIVLALGEPGVLLRVGLLELLVKIVSGFVFIHYWGLPGLAWSAVLSFWVEKGALMAYLWRRKNISAGQWLHLRWYWWYALLLLGSSVAISI
jgi:O-antigen/teichoic acid export membrane protein